MCLPVNKKGHFLVTQRSSPGNTRWHNKWQVAGGGIDFGESPQQALAREVQEELKVSVKIIFPYPIVKSISYNPGEDDDFPERKVHITFACYLVDIGNQKIDVSGDDETKSFKWINPQKIHELDCLPLTKEFIEDAEKIVKNHHLLTMLQ